jgi:DNA-binding NarL/FixJ family response regulator
MKTTRILLADDQPRVRFGLRVLLRHQSGLEIVGEVADFEELFKQTLTLEPDLILLDWELPGLIAMSSLPDLRRVQPQMLIIALSGRPEARKAALSTGANAFVSKSDPPDCLLMAIAEQVLLERIRVG